MTSSLLNYTIKWRQICRTDWHKEFYIDISDNYDAAKLAFYIGPETVARIHDYLTP